MLLKYYSTSRYLDDLLNIDNPYFEQMVGQIYPIFFQLNKGNFYDTETPFSDIVLSKIFDQRGDFNFEIVNFTFQSGDVPRSSSYSVCYVIDLK